MVGNTAGQKGVARTAATIDHSAPNIFSFGDKRELWQEGLTIWKNLHCCMEQVAVAENPCAAVLFQARIHRHDGGNGVEPNDLMHSLLANILLKMR